jgi:hypothetical protein
MSGTPTPRKSGKPASGDVFNLSGNFSGAIVNIKSTIVGEAEVKDIETLPPEPGAPPYQGLQYFDEKDANLFFGRELLTAKLVNRLAGTRFLAVIGASGSGKSSLVRAGVIPALRRGERLADGSLPPADSAHWEVRIFTPTAHPLEALAACLARDAASVQEVSALEQDLATEPRALALAASKLLAGAGQPRLLLVIDQFEELFAQVYQAEERRAFIANLLAAVEPGDAQPITLLILLRADFYARLAEFDQLRELVAQNQEFIGAMSRDELVRAIVQPAAAGNWKIQEGLVEVILEDIGDEPGALPLLSHALLETWKRRHARTMTLSGYTEAGGVRGAIAQTAETVFRQRLTPAQQPIARMIFIRLAELGDGAQDTRRRAAFSELITRSTDPATIDAVLAILTDSRLVITDTVEPGDVKVVEVAHEALIREWPTLRQWLNENRAGLVLHRELADDTNRWQRLDRDAGALYRGAQLQQALDWAQKNPTMLNLSEQDFLDASRVQAAAEAERDRQLKRTAVLRRLVFPAIGVLLLGVLAVLFFTSGLNYRFRTPAKMDGAFNVAVANSSVIRPDGSVITATSGAGADASGWVANELSKQFGADPNFEVWRDGPDLRPLNVTIGRVQGATPAEQVQAAQTMAERLNAHMVIFGVLDESQTPARLTLQAWIAPRLDYHFEDIQGSYQAGAPIEIADPEHAGIEALPEITRQAGTLAWLAVGLTQARFGQTGDALAAFHKAENLAPDSEAVQFFIGQESLFQSDRNTSSQQALTAQAEQAFSKALQLNPDYARATIGLGSVYFAMAKRLVLAVQAGEASGQAGKDLQQAATQVDQGLAAYKRVFQLPTAAREIGVPVDLAAKLGIGTSLRLQGEIDQRSGQTVQARVALQGSVQTLEALVQPFQDAGLQRYLAQTYQTLGTAYQWQGYLAELDQNVAQSQTAYNQALKDYNACIDLGKTSPDLIVQNDIARDLCLPFRKQVQDRLDVLSGGSS